MHAGVGPGLLDFLGELKEAQMKALEAEFARNPFEVTEKVTRVVREELDSARAAPPPRSQAMASPAPTSRRSSPKS